MYLGYRIQNRQNGSKESKRSIFFIFLLDFFKEKKCEIFYKRKKLHFTKIDQ